MRHWTDEQINRYARWGVVAIVAVVVLAVLVVAAIDSLGSRRDTEVLSAQTEAPETTQPAAEEGPVAPAASTSGASGSARLETRTAAALTSTTSITPGQTTLPDSTTVADATTSSTSTTPTTTTTSIQPTTITVSTTTTVPATTTRPIEGVFVTRFSAVSEGTSDDWTVTLLIDLGVTSGSPGGATVSVTWSGPAEGAGSFVANGGGKIRAGLGPFEGGPLEVRITGVLLSGYEYQPEHDTVPSSLIVFPPAD